MLYVCDKKNKERQREREAHNEHHFLLQLKWIEIAVYRTSIHRAHHINALEHSTYWHQMCVGQKGNDGSNTTMEQCLRGGDTQKKERGRERENGFALNVFAMVSFFAQFSHCHLWFLLHCWRRNYYVIDFALGREHHHYFRHTVWLYVVLGLSQQTQPLNKPTTNNNNNNDKSKKKHISTDTE